MCPAEAFDDLLRLVTYCKDVSASDFLERYVPETELAKVSQACAQSMAVCCCYCKVVMAPHAQIS